MSKTQWLYNTRINTRELPEMLALGKRLNKPVCILAPSGVGKTEITQQYADKVYNGNCVTVILSHHDTTDLVGQGIPVYEDGKLFMKLSESALIPMDPDFEGVLFLDEITNIDTPMAHVLYQLINERKCGGKPLPKKMQICLAGNRVFDNGASSEILGPLANRMIIVEMEPEAQHWLEDYGSMVNLHPAIYQYVHNNPDKLYEYGSEDDCPSFASGRSMKAASDVFWDLQHGNCSDKIAMVSVDGSIGNDKFLQIFPLYEAAIKLPDPMTILNGKFDKQLDKDVGLAGIFSVLSSCIYHLTNSIKNNKDCCVDYGKNLVKFIANNLLDEKEIIVNYITKICKLGQEHGKADFIMQIRKDNPSFTTLLKDNLQFEQQIKNLMCNA